MIQEYGEIKAAADLDSAPQDLLGEDRADCGAEQLRARHQMGNQ